MGHGRPAKRQNRELAQQLLTQQKVTIRKARTLLNLEELTTQIGDELTRQLANTDLAERAVATAQVREHVCPNCGQKCPIETDRELRILQGVVWTGANPPSGGAFAAARVAGS